jgi:S1-C subfamily serine protease
MQKKIIYMVLFVSLLGGFIGGAVSVYWFGQVSEQANEVMVVPAGASADVETSPLIAAQQAVAPAVISIVQYISDFQNEGVYNYGNYAYDIREIGGGTGFIVDPSGLVITNKHVVASDLYAYGAMLTDGTRFDLKIEARDPFNDVAIARLVAPSGTYAHERLGDLPYARLGNSSYLRVGEPVLAIGNALTEYANTTTAGIISATGRQVVASDALGGVSSLSGLIQTDAAINFGNSGGPLVDLKGEVIALNTALDDEARGIGFAIPINDVIPALESYRNYGEIIRPFLGVRYTLLTESRAQSLGLAVSQGAFLFSDPENGEPAVEIGSPAYVASLQEGDVILSVDGVSVTLMTPLQDLIGPRQVGEEVTLLIWRSGEQFEVNVELTNRG